MQKALKQHLRTIASIAALDVNADDVLSVKRAGEKSPAYIPLVKQLEAVKTHTPEARFVYIMVKTADPMKFAFVADGAALSSVKELDHNGNGTVDEEETASHPGDLYDVSDFDMLRGPAFQEPVTDDVVTVDSWGAWISGYAPIRDKNGVAIAVLGLDMDAQEFLHASHSAFSPIAVLLSLLVALLLGCMIVLSVTRRRVELVNRMNNERSGLLRLTFHQLGEPLTIMKWSLESLREQTRSEELRLLVDEHVVCMDEGLGRLNSIIDTLQQAEKVDLNTLQYLPKRSSLNSLVGNAVNEWQSSLLKRKQTIEVDMPDDLQWSFDFNLIAIVLRQLIQNAIEYSADGASITIHVSPTQHHVQCSVEDHGCGIPTSDLGHLFEKYRRGSNAPIHKPDGNGLGLYIARGIVQKAGGRMTVESIENVGTKVSFTLPKHS